MLEYYVLFQNGEDITETVEPYLKVIDLQDNLGLEADLLELEFFNADLFFTQIFTRGDYFELDLYDENRDRLATGKFYVDSIRGSVGPENTLYVSCISSPVDRSGLKTQTSYSKKSVKLKTLLEDLLKRAGMNLFYRFNRKNGESWDIDLKNVSIMDETIGEVVSEHANAFGCLVKIHDEQLIFSDKNSFKFDTVVRTMDPSVDPLENFSFEYNPFQQSDYEIRYYDPKTGKTTFDKKKNDSELVTDNDSIKKISQKIGDPNQARAIAQSVDGQHMINVSFETIGDPSLVAGAVIEITELLLLSGKYVIVKAEHNISDENWTTSIEAVNLF